MIFSLLTFPIDGFRFILSTLGKVAEEQWTDDAPLKEQLLELQVKLENSDITEDEYVEAEAAILRSLRDIQNRRRELAGTPEATEGLSGRVKEGSGASLTFEIEGPDSATYGLAAAETAAHAAAAPRGFAKRSARKRTARKRSDKQRR